MRETVEAHSNALPILAFRQQICDMVNRQFISVVREDDNHERRHARF